MRAIVLSLVAVVSILLLLSMSAQAITISPNVTFIPSTDFSVYFDSSTAIRTIRVESGAMTVNGYGFEIDAANHTNLTITSWPQVSAPYAVFQFVFQFDVNTTVGTNVSFTFDDNDQISWFVLRDGEELTSGGSGEISFSSATWVTGVNVSFILTEIPPTISTPFVQYFIVLGFLAILVLTLVGAWRLKEMRL